MIAWAICSVSWAVSKRSENPGGYAEKSISVTSVGVQKR
jgi:hypothetical protein